MGYRKKHSDLTGIRFGRLLVINRDATPRKSTNAHWACVCDCGSHTIVRGSHLVSGKILSCGCYRAEVVRVCNVTHGKSGSPTAKTWYGLKKRCSTKKGDDYHNYSERGITVCERWLESFDNFLADMGERPSSKHSIDRINNNGPYSPENCRWATAEEQQNNRRSNASITVEGITLTYRQWSKRLGGSVGLVSTRIFSGWDPITAATTPPMKKTDLSKINQQEDCSYLPTLSTSLA